MTTWQPPHRIGLPAAQQEWRSVAFLHWRYDPAMVEALLPEGVEPDTFDGAAWVGITPFALDASLLPLVARPSVAAGEVNVRTYVRVGEDQGLWFLSLELDKSMVAKSLRTVLQLPYRTAHISIDRTDDQAAYRLRRDDQDDGTTGLDLTVSIGERIGEDQVDDLHVFLLARWRAFTQAYGKLLTVPVEHRSWPVRRAEVVHLDGDLIASIGLPPPEGDPHVVFSEGVHARLGAPRPVLR